MSIEGQKSPEANEELAAWVIKFTDDLYSWAYYKTSSKELAEDLVQDTFVAALKGMPKFKRDSNPKTWLYSILNNKIADYYRKKLRSININEPDNSSDRDEFDKFFDSAGLWHHDQVPTDWGSPDSILDDEEFYKVLLYCLENLPEKWSLVIRLKYIDDKAGDYICKELNVTKTNYWQILHRSKLNLRKCLEINWFCKEQ